MANARVSRGRRTQVVVADWLQAHGWLTARAPWGSEQGEDIKNMPWHCIEIKARKDFNPGGWLKQARDRAKNGDKPCAVIRLNGQGEKPDEYIVIRRLADDELALGPEASATLRALADQIAEESSGTSDR